MKDFYYILGIEKSSSIEEIKSAYRKLSHKFHPDKNDGDKFFEERFKDIQEAYETLSRPDKRKIYDTALEEYNRKNEFRPRQEDFHKSEEDFTASTDYSTQNKYYSEEDEQNYAEMQSEVDEEPTERKGTNIPLIIFFGLGVIAFIIYLIVNKIEDYKSQASSSNVNKVSVYNNRDNSINDYSNSEYNNNSQIQTKEIIEISKKLTPKYNMIYSLKVYGFNYNTKAVLENYLNNFDSEYDNYKRNEFLLKSKTESALAEISSLVNELKFPDEYVIELESRLGKYDFESQQFVFRPFNNYDPDKVIEWSNWSRIIFERYYFFKYTNIPEVEYNTSDVYIYNYKDFDGVKMDSKQAETLLARNTDNSIYGSRVNRTVYLKVYFNILNMKLPGNGASGLYCYIKKVDVWNDKNMQSDLITTLNAKTNSPDFLEQNTDSVIQYPSDGIQNDSLQTTKSQYTDSVINSNEPKLNNLLPEPPKEEIRVKRYKLPAQYPVSQQNNTSNNANPENQNGNNKSNNSGQYSVKGYYEIKGGYQSTPPSNQRKQNRR